MREHAQSLDGASASSDTPVKQAVSRPSLWIRIRFFLLMALLLFVMHQTTGFMKVSGHSMEPTLQHGDVLLMNKLSLLFAKPQYGDVVIIREESLGYNIVKRVIAVEGDVVSIADGVTYVNGRPLIELYTFGTSEDMAELHINEGHLFVAGDHRAIGESLDSRDPRIGQIHESEISAYIVASLWPLHGIAKPLE
jgi:signal peptidase I